MNLANSIHRNAMEFMMYAEMAKAKEMHEDAKDAYLIAYILEKKAVEKIHPTDNESKFVLMRSAASLAYKADLFEESKILIKKCKAVNPPSWILEELKELTILIKKKQQSKIKNKAFNLEGILTGINSDENKITLQIFEKESISVLIPSNLLTEIVQKYWTKRVQIQARKTSSGIVILENIKTAA